MKGGKDPLPVYYGKRIPKAAAVIIPAVLLLGGLSVIAYGVSNEGSEEVEKLASVRCLGCLGLDPVVPGFRGFWTTYPEGHEKEGLDVPHRPTVLYELSKQDVDLVILFFWGPGCGPCKEQWDEMKGRDIVQGTEEEGREGSAYEGVRVISVDQSRDEVGYYWTYHINGDERYNGIPVTTLIFEKDEEVRWWSHYGPMDVDLLEDLILIVLYEEGSSS